MFQIRDKIKSSKEKVKGICRFYKAGEDVIGSPMAGPESVWCELQNFE